MRFPPIRQQESSFVDDRSAEAVKKKSGSNLQCREEKRAQASRPPTSWQNAILDPHQSPSAAPHSRDPKRSTTSTHVERESFIHQSPSAAPRSMVPKLSTHLKRKSEVDDPVIAIETITTGPAQHKGPARGPALRIMVPNQQRLHPTNGDCIQGKALLLKRESSFFMN